MRWGAHTLLVLAVCGIQGCAQQPKVPLAAACVPPAAAAQDYLTYVKEEPIQPLVCDSKREIYRFISDQFHLGTEVHLLRIDVAPGGHATMTLRYTDFVIGGTPPLIFDKSRALTDAEFAEFRKAFDASGFWNLPSQPKDMPCVPNGMSLLEVVRDGRYHDRARYCGGERSMDRVFAIVKKLGETLK